MNLCTLHITAFPGLLACLQGKTGKTQSGTAIVGQGPDKWVLEFSGQSFATSHGQHNTQGFFCREGVNEFLEAKRLHKAFQSSQKLSKAFQPIRQSRRRLRQRSQIPRPL